MHMAWITYDTFYRPATSERLMMGSGDGIKLLVWKCNQLTINRTDDTDFE